MSSIAKETSFCGRETWNMATSTAGLMGGVCGAGWHPGGDIGSVAERGERVADQRDLFDARDQISKNQHVTACGFSYFTVPLYV